MLLLQGRISSPQNMTLCVIGRVRFERNCGKMYSRRLFPYGGLVGGQVPSPGSPAVIHVDERAIQYIVSIAKVLWSGKI